MIRVIKNNFELKALENELEHTQYNGDWGGINGNKELDTLDEIMSGVDDEGLL